MVNWESGAINVEEERLLLLCQREGIYLMNNDERRYLAQGANITSGTLAVRFCIEGYQKQSQHHSRLSLLL
jgi:hypothetical protein